MTIEEYLKPFREKDPQWLSDYQPGDLIDFRDVMSSRIVYYPGSKFDGQPIKTFNRAHYAHVFIYTDYWTSRREYLSELEYDGFRGYHLLRSISISESEIAPRGWTGHVDLSSDNKARLYHPETPFCELSIFERDSDQGDDFGNKRFALIYLCADGIATYDALFGNGYYKIDTLVLQDHGFGGNYDRFGKGGLMNEIASVTGIYPQLILCAEHTANWDGYDKIADVEPVIGGMHNNLRYLYRKS